MARKSQDQLLQELIDAMQPELQKAFTDAIQDIVDRAIISEIIKAIESGEIDKILNILQMNDAAMRPITAAIEKAFEQGGIFVASTFPKQLVTPSGKIVFRFDVRNSRAEKWLREKSSGLVQKISEDARISIRNIVTRGTESGRNPRSVALDIVGRINPITKKREGGIIGLTPNQELWIDRVRRELTTLDSNYLNKKLRDKRFDSIVKKAIADKTPLKPETVDKLVSRYKDNALRYRGETIARTETIEALNQSQNEAYEQAVETGALDRRDVVREWDATLDKRTREDHRQMNGQKVGINEPFKAPDGSLMMYPGDKSLGAAAEQTINCRCRVKLVVDWFAKLERENG